MAPLSRRDFLAQTGSCAAHLSLAAALLPPTARRSWLRPTLGRVVAQEKFARIEEVGRGVWAVISDPFSGDRTTLSNGALVAGREGVLAIEGFFQPAGAKWLAEQAKRLTGKWPTHVLLSHYHGDHVNGVAGYLDGGPAPIIRATKATTDQVLTRNQPADEARARVLAAAVPVDPDRESTIDLGGRVVRITPRAGHTASDVVASIEDPRVVFCGDLVWNGIFPNYVDCVPTKFRAAIAALRRDGDPVYVTGHGPLSKNVDLDRYLAMVDEVERAARSARQRGLAPAAAAAEYKIPESVGQWTLFGPRFLETAFTAWNRELDGK